MYTHLLQKFESALQQHNPILASRLQPGLAEVRVRKMLDKAGAKGIIDPIVALFSWRNGTQVDPSLSQSQASPFPNSVYMYPDLEMLTAHFVGYLEGARYHPRMIAMVGRYFPMFWDGSSSWLAVDLEASKHSRVVILETEWENPVKEAYHSFGDFLNDAIVANETNESLICFQSIR